MYTQVAHDPPWLGAVKGQRTGQEIMSRISIKILGKISIFKKIYNFFLKTDFKTFRGVMTDKKFSVEVMTDDWGDFRVRECMITCVNKRG